MAKKTQNILVLDSNFFGTIKPNSVRLDYYHNKNHLLNDDVVGGHLSLRQRERVEFMEQYRQVLPYVVVYDTLPSGEKLYFPYRRTNLVGDSRMAGNVSVGYGGHIDAPDVLWNSDGSINIRQTIIEALNRELEEEITIVEIDNPERISTAEVTDVIVPSVILSHADIAKNGEIPVGNVHAGFVIFQPIPPNSTVKTAEDELTSMEPMTAKQILESGLPIEEWTRVVLEQETVLHERATRILNEEFGTVSLDADLPL